MALEKATALWGKWKFLPPVSLGRASPGWKIRTLLGSPSLWSCKQTFFIVLCFVDSGRAHVAQGACREEIPTVFWNMGKVWTNQTPPDACLVE